MQRSAWRKRRMSFPRYLANFFELWSCWLVSRGRMAKIPRAYLNIHIILLFLIVCDPSVVVNRPAIETELAESRTLSWSLIASKSILTEACRGQITSTSRKWYPGWLASLSFGLCDSSLVPTLQWFSFTDHDWRFSWWEWWVYLYVGSRLMSLIGGLVRTDLKAVL